MVCYFMSDNVLLKNLPNSKGVTIMKIVQGCGGRGAGGVGIEVAGGFGH
jgi:hypothetical protein